jgi:hypothetical protein
MPRNLHEHYDELTPDEMEFVDAAFKKVADVAKTRKIRLFGDDRMEAAVDALAKLVIESRE